MTELRCGDRTFAVGARTYVMGIVNVTPDSFSDGGKYLSTPAAIAHGLQLIADGADVLDIGGESTRPGAVPVPIDDELRRVVPVIEGLVAAGVRNISIDTRRARVADAALRAGAAWVNDVSALSDDAEMGGVAARADAVVLMHREAMAAGAEQDAVEYLDVVNEVREMLSRAVSRAESLGITRDKIVVDPGLGFGKTLEHNLRLLQSSAALSTVAPVLMGASRKRFLGVLTNNPDPAGRDIASLGAVACAAHTGAFMVRVHDVKSSVELLKVVDAARRHC